MASCSEGSVNPAAEAAAARFHSQYNSGEFLEIYQQADPEYKKSKSESEVTAFLDSLQKTFGRINVCDQKSSETTISLTGARVVLTYRVEFDGGEGTEVIGFLVRGEKARLNYYKLSVGHF